jgi:four helix bundle protein
MKYRRFEELPVWKASARLMVRVDALCDDAALRARGDIADQMHRATLSISNNIAEGFEQGTTQQLLTHLYHAKGSAGEVRSILHVVCGMARLAHLKDAATELRQAAEEISRQLGAFAATLQDSDVEGHRYLTEDARIKAEARTRREAFELKMATIIADARAAREQSVQ